MSAFEEFGNGIAVFTNEIVMDGLRDLAKLSPTWKTQYVGILVLLFLMEMFLLVASFSGARVAESLGRFIAWIMVTMIIAYPFLYWVDKSGFLSGLTFFVYFVYTYSVIGSSDDDDEKSGSNSILANLIASTVLFGLIIWYYTWDMVLWWFKRIGLWLFLFNMVLARGFRGGIEKETSNWKLVTMGMFIILYFIAVFYLGYEFVDKDVGRKGWDGARPLWK